ncbi:MAG: type III-A CRISPR-associated RAMP protein Csm5 [Balneolaceae bacterium]|nr:type III-A CRISPR-associated RAMP protein Csm5 [Balneolaceae bacterium]
MNLSDIQQITGSESKIDKRTFTVVPYSPVFIGSGMSMRKGLDFYSSRGYTHFFDHQKIYKNYLSDIDALEQSLIKGELDRYITDQGDNLSDFTKQSVTGDVLGQELMQPVRDGFGNPILPGSSLKGSIRTALFSDLLNERNLKVADYERIISGRKVGGNALENELLSTAKKRGKAPNYDLGRALRISDATFKKADLEVFNSVVVNKTHNGYQYKVMGRGAGNSVNLSDATLISALALSFDVDLVQPADITISVDNTALKSIKWKGSFDFDYIANACNALSKRLIKYEQDYFNKAVQDIAVLETINEEYKYLLEDVNQCIKDTENGKISWMIRTGWGSGWLSMTGGHGFLSGPDGKKYIESLRKVAQFLFKKTKDYKYPKTRKVVLDVAKKPASVMGWLLFEQKN